MFRRILGIIFAISMVGCNSESQMGDMADYHLNIKRNTAAPTEPFPGPKVADAGRYLAKIESAESLEALFPVERLVRLELTDQSLIGNIGDILFQTGFWFILDTLQGSIYQFGKEGNFIKRIGTRGEGPGEYIRPLSMRACFEDNLAVYDGMKGEILVFDSGGNHVTTMQKFSGNFKIVPNSGFLWDEKPRLYLFSYPSFNQEAPWHVLVNPFSKTAPYDVITGFGRRFEPLKEMGLGSWSFQAIANIEGRIWTGPPYYSYLEIFDREGRFLARIGDLPRPEKISTDDFEKVKDKKGVIRLRLEKDANAFLRQVGPLVIVYLKNFSDIYDTNGNLIRSPIKRSKLGILREAFYENEEWYVVSTLSIQDDASKYSDADYRALVDSGFDIENLEQENPYLRIGRLAHD